MKIAVVRAGGGGEGSSSPLHWAWPLVPRVEETVVLVAAPAKQGVV